MLKKAITYEDFNGATRTEDFYFDLRTSELHEWENSINGGMNTLLSRIVQERDQSELIKYFKEIIARSYGQKSDDGKHFRKSPEILDDFISTNAYDKLYMELVTDTKKAIAFIKGIVPPELGKEITIPENDEVVADVLMPAT